MDGGGDKLACRIVPFDPKTFVAFTFPCNVSAGVKLVAKRAVVLRGVSISLSEFAVIELTVYEFKKYGALHRSEVKLFVDDTVCRRAP